jgi:hypothetical protein
MHVCHSRWRCLRSVDLHLSRAVSGGLHAETTPAKPQDTALYADTVETASSWRRMAGHRKAFRNAPRADPAREIILGYPNGDVDNSSSARTDGLAGALLPHLHVSHRETSRVPLTPSGVPSGLSVPELFHRIGTPVSPRLVAYSIREEAIGTSDRNVEDEIERLVKWSAGPARLRPWIIEGRVVDDGLPEASTVLFEVSQGVASR